MSQPVPAHAAWLLADWPAPAAVRGLTTRRHGAGSSSPPFDHFNLGNRSAADGDEAAVVERNRAELARLAQLPSWPHWLRQVHGTGVFRANVAGQPLAASDEPVADAAVTDQPGVVLAILTADCLPVLFSAADGSEIAAAHAGWRGLADGMLEATVAAMHTAPGQLLAWLGPAAGPQHYEIGQEVRDAFLAHDRQAATAFVATTPGHWRVDLYALARQRLVAAGMRPEAISGGNRCTIGEPESFFSHRRDRRSGRIASLIWIDPATALPAAGVQTGPG